MKITELVNKKLIKIDYNFRNKNDVIHNLSTLLYENAVINSIEGFTEAVIKRESQSSTAVGFGIAIPHARSEYVNQPGIAIGRSTEFSWDGGTDQLIRLVFLLAVPDKIDYPEYMVMLASISRMLVHQRFRNALLSAQNIDDFIDEISAGERYLVNGNKNKKKGSMKKGGNE